MKRHIKILIVLFIITIIIRVIGAGDSEFFVMGVIILLYGLFISFIITRKSNNKVMVILGWIYQCIIAFFIGSFIIFEGIIFFNILEVKSPFTAPTVNYAIVLGAGLDGTHVGNILEERVNSSIKYLQSHENSKIIVSGGQGPGEVISEADAMKNYLEENGISPDRILEDNKSKTTVQNIEFSKKILEENNAVNQKVVIITSAFNVFRVEIVAKMLGINAEVIGARSPLRMSLNYSIREYPATIVDILRIARTY